MCRGFHTKICWLVQKADSHNGSAGTASGGGGNSSDQNHVREYYKAALQTDHSSPAGKNREPIPDSGRDEYREVIDGFNHMNEKRTHMIAEAYHMELEKAA